MNIPAGIEKKPIALKVMPTDAVVTFDIVQSVATEAGVPTMKASMAFMNAHMALGIKLRSDKARGLGWVTADEAEQIRAHMIANV